MIWWVTVRVGGVADAIEQPYTSRAAAELVRELILEAMRAAPGEPTGLDWLKAPAESIVSVEIRGRD